MWCLWNGEYGEHDLSYVPCIETAIKNQEEQYKNYIGAVVGDFTCINVEYDWGNRGQRWTLKCNLCGRESYKKNAKDLYEIVTGAGLEALYPQGAFYMWIKSPVENEYDFVSAAKKERILITPGSAFNGPGWVRASFCGKNETIQNSKESWMNLGRRFNLI